MATHEGRKEGRKCLTLSVSSAVQLNALALGAQHGDICVDALVGWGVGEGGGTLHLPKRIRIVGHGPTP